MNERARRVLSRKIFMNEKSLIDNFITKSTRHIPSHELYLKRDDFDSQNDDILITSHNREIEFPL